MCAAAVIYDCGYYYIRLILAAAAVAIEIVI